MMQAYLRLRGELRRIGGKLKNSGSCMEEDEKDTLYQRKVELNIELHRTRVALYRDTKRLKRRRYFNTVDVDEIERQLACGGDEDEGGQDAVDQKPERLTYQLPEREDLVRLFF